MKYGKCKPLREVKARGSLKENKDGQKKHKSEGLKIKKKKNWPEKGEQVGQSESANC